MRDLGLLGESTFDAWCAQEGLVSNGSKVDRTGWDFYVEFPLPQTPRAFDGHQNPPECKVQLKSTDNRSRKNQVTLANLQRMATAHQPCFYLFLEFDGMSQPQRAFLMHVGSELITKILKTVREAQHGPKRKKLNSAKMTLKYADSYQLESMDGASLKKGILNFIGENLSDYVNKKMEHLRRTGFEDGDARVLLQADGQNSFPLLVDAMLGSGGSVPISRFTATQTRFGILDSSPYIDSFNVEIAISHVEPTSKGKMLFWLDRLAPSLCFDVRIYTLPFVNQLPEALRKVRIDGGFFELVTNFSTTETTVNIAFDHGDAWDLFLLKDALDLCVMLSSKGNEIYSEIKLGGSRSLPFVFAQTKVDPILVEELSTVNKLLDVAAALRVRDVGRVTLSDVMRFASQVNIFSLMLSGERVQFKTVIPDGCFDVGQGVACIALIQCPVGRHVAAALISTFGEVASVSKKETVIYSGEYKVEKTIVVERGGTVPHELISAEVERIEDLYCEDYFVATLVEKTPPAPEQHFPD